MPNNSRRDLHHILFCEKLDSRILFNSLATPLASGALLQDWSIVSLIQTANNWSNVPSIEGYRGSTLGVSTTGVDPQTVLAPNDATATPQVYANLATPASSTSAGVAEFHLSNPTIAFQGGSLGAAPHVVLFLNTSGLSDLVPVSYVLRDIDDQTTKATQPIAAQYRLGDSGDFINIPAGFVADAAGPAGTATKTTSVSFHLPAETLDQPLVQFRIITTDAEGADEWIGIDDIRIGADQPKAIQFSKATFQNDESAGTISVTLNRLGDLSAAAQVTLSSSDLTASAGQDYSSLSQVVAFAAGQATKSIPLTILEDSLSESAERISLSLSNASGASIGAQSSATAIIIDNDSTAPEGLLINEISVDPPGTVDTPYEFAEIRGTANAPLRNVYLVQLEGDLASPIGRSGVADVVFDLGESSTGSNGLLMISATGGFAAAEAGTTTVFSPLLNIGNDALENDAQSWLLIFSPVPILAQKDYDLFTTAGGALQLPSGAVVLDSLAWRGQTDINSASLYSDAVLDPPLLAAATRFRGNVTPASAAAWYFGSLDAAQGNTALQYDPESSSQNLPANASLTPGAPNYTGGADTAPPGVLAVNWRFDLIATRPYLEIIFSEAMQTPTMSDFVPCSFTVVDRTTDNKITAAAFTLTQPSPSVCRIAFAESGIPADGNYRLRLNAANLNDLAGNAMTQNDSFDFSFQQGDATGDGFVDAADFNSLAGHFGGSSARFSEGDFTFNGEVDSMDFVLFVAVYGKRLPAMTSSALFSALPPAEEDPFLPV